VITDEVLAVVEIARAVDFGAAEEKKAHCRMELIDSSRMGAR
jgi:hypothetical protein